MHRGWPYARLAYDGGRGVGALEAGGAGALEAASGAFSTSRSGWVSADLEKGQAAVCVRARDS